LVRASSALPLLSFIDGGGAELGRVRERIQTFVHGPDSLIPLAFGGWLFEDAARATGIDDLGLRLGLATNVETFGEWGGLIARSPTAATFLDAAIANYRRFNTGYRIWTVTRGDELWLHQSYSRVLRRGRAHVLDLSLLMWLGAFRKLFGPAWKPSAVYREGDPPRHAAAIEALADRVFYRQPTQVIVFPRALLARRRAIAPGAPAPRAEGPVPAQDFRGSVQQTVASLLRLGALDLRVAGETAGMSERSFQRKLASADLTFSGLVENARFEVACRMLADSAMRVIDVSAELGYSNSANFTRAFRRWSGVPPQRFRQAAADLHP
jgi:AraC-like DNA-binding protein